MRGALRVLRAPLVHCDLLLKGDGTRCDTSAVSLNEDYDHSELLNSTPELTLPKQEAVWRV